jgi:hypothetical protein
MSLRDMGSFCDPNDKEFEVPQKIAHRGSYDNFLVQSQNSEIQREPAKNF